MTRATSRALLAAAAGAVLLAVSRPPLAAQGTARGALPGAHAPGAHPPGAHALRSRSAGDPADSAVARFVEQARDGTRRYHDRGAAIADGYRLIGPDFPGMGEHWIHLGRLFGARFEPERPAVLEYATIGGAPRLVGVAYVLPLLGDEAPPDFPPGHAWHDHVRTVDEESVLIDQVPSGHGGGCPRGGCGRIAMLHAWVWMENPAGMFESDNWALPFARVGVGPPDEPSPTAGRAMSLAAGGDAYYAALFQAVGKPVAPDSAAIAGAVAAARREVELLVRQRAGAPLGPGDAAELDAVWARMWHAITRAIRPAVRERLRAVEGRSR